MQIRLYKWQCEKLNNAGCSGAAIIRYAYQRYLRGDFSEVAQNSGNPPNSENVPLTGYSIRSRFPVSDALMRKILTAHFNIPDKIAAAKLDKEIKQLDTRIDEMMKLYANVPYIVEESK